MRNLLFIIMLFVSYYNSLPAQILGMTAYGGDSNSGTIFSMSPGGTNFTIRSSFQTIEGQNPTGSLTLTPDGKMYGTTNLGGVNNGGLLFQFDPTTGNYNKKYDFDYTNGNRPNGTLLLATDGKLYGTASFGGNIDKGVIFQFDPATSTYIKKYDFDLLLNGATPYGSLMQASNGKLYGMTYSGGSNNSGVLYEFDPVTSVFAKLVDFVGTSTGANPAGALMQANDGMLYGMTSYGGTGNKGVIFQYNISTNVLVKKVDFNGSINGRAPVGELMEASNGMLYGLTETGGVYNSGVLFEYDATMNIYTKKYDFSSSAGGYNPTGTLFENPDGMLYGTTSQGGAVAGVVFQYNPITSVYSQTAEFGSSGGNPNKLLIQGYDGSLYGTCYGGGNGSGTIYKYNPVDSSMVGIVRFGDALSGRLPFGSLVQTHDRKIYGMSRSGGINNFGTVFQFDETNNNYSKLCDINTNGLFNFPEGSLAEASNGKLYGVSSGGGIFSCGVLFEFDPVINICSIKRNFNDFDGRTPAASLIKASDNKLYGITKQGGTDTSGVLFQFDPVTNVFIKKFDFNLTNSGYFPMGSLMQASDGMLYGTTSGGGANGVGTIFQFNPVTNVFIKKADFTSIDGRTVYGSLVEANDGNLYGLTYFGGVNNKGTLFQYNITTSAFTKMIDFDGINNGANPKGGLLLGSDGLLYGMATSGGANNKGILFNYDPANNTLVKTLDFNTLNGASPQFTSLIELLPPVISIGNIDTVICAGDQSQVPITTIGGFDLANTYSVVLSDQNGSFSSPVIIGTLNANTSSIINITIPSNTIPGSNYRMYVKSSHPIITDTTETNVTITIDNIFPAVNITATDTIICYGGSVTLTASGADVYTWPLSVTDGIAFIPDSSSNYIVSGTSLNGCSAKDSVLIVVDHSCSPVFPGDVNNDGIANTNDLLELGIQYGTIGFPRTIQSNSWQSFDAPLWGTDTVTTGYNLNHADCNGDGTINLDDTLAINLNYGLTHTLRLADINKTNTTGDIYFGSAQLGYGAGQQVAIDVYLGESTNPLQNFYGAAFTIDYNDNTLVQPGSLSFSIDDVSWVGTINTDAIRLTKPMEASETIDAAICKTNHVNTSGAGKIGALRFIASNTIGNFSVTASNAYYIDNAAIQTPLTSATYTVNINTAVGLQNQTSNSNISIYPNPNNGSFTLSNLNSREEYKLEVKDVLGRTVYTDVIKSNSSKANIKLNQAAGIYWLQITSKQGVTEVHKVVVE